MASTILFVIAIIIVAILLFIFAITSTIAVGDIYNSIYYNTDPRAKSAYQYLIISAALGWTALVFLVIILIVAIFTGGFSLIDVSPDFLAAGVDYNQLGQVKQLKLHEAIGELASGRTTQIVLFVVLIIIAIAILVTIIIIILALVNLADMPQFDSNANNAFINTIIGTISIILSIGFMIASIISYNEVCNDRSEKLRILASKIGVKLE